MSKAGVLVLACLMASAALVAAPTATAHHCQDMQYDDELRCEAWHEIEDGEALVAWVVALVQELVCPGC